VHGTSGKNWTLAEKKTFHFRRGEEQNEIVQGESRHPPEKKISRESKPT